MPINPRRSWATGVFEAPPFYLPRLTRPCHNSTVSKFKIGQSVQLVPSVGGTALEEYRIVERLPQAGKVILYRVRSSADERSEMVVMESEVRQWRKSKLQFDE